MLATVVSLGEYTPGQIDTTRDVDYFTMLLPHAGLFTIETIGSTDTTGTVWQGGIQLAMADSGGVRQNFQISAPVAAQPVVVAVAGNGEQTGSYTLKATLVAGYLENPGPHSFQSGIGVISGWVCEAERVEVELGALGRQMAGYGTGRADTLDVCGDADNGFGLLVNWNLLGDGVHTVVALADEEELGRATVRVTTLGAEFLRGVEGECLVEDFPMLGETVTLEWQQTSQNFVIADVEME